MPAQPAPASAHGAESAYALEITEPLHWVGADAILVQGAEPIELAAELKLAGEAPAGFREVSRRIRWQAAAGEIKPDNAARDGGQASWIPPSDSRVVEVAAEAEIALEPASGGAATTIRKRAALKFLTPLSSAGMDRGVLDGYDIGEYPSLSKKGDSVDGDWVRANKERYALPPGFYRVGTDEKSLKLSPHITLGHFVIDYPWRSLGMPQYVAIDPNLVQKLEDLIALMNKDGKFDKVTKLVPIYGFRSPRFNRESIENTPEANLKVKWSMHQYGRAMDFIIDEDDDLVMDDLNKDGKHDIYDAREIMHYVNILDRQYRDEKRMEMVGGAGLYEFHDFQGRKTSPYIHVDTRGFLRGDGTLIRWKEPHPELWPDGTPIRWSKI